ncbi:hypothetical protein [Persicobacter psychrovividus]|uniref:Uncharacterized protein n=1 Tax=Persicobacter psychrovividus TaxID=387638 RepID=A0ABM7VBM0_9BACT|nr:hypothetical protein PEPS_05900 [Persicobacter psychrovividus]
MKNIIIPSVLFVLLFVTGQSIAQNIKIETCKESELSKFTVTNEEGKEIEGEAFFEQWAETFGNRMEHADEKGFAEIFSGFGMSMSELGEALGRMNIEIKNLAPDEFCDQAKSEGSCEQWEKLRAKLEKRHHSTIENIERLKIKLHDKTVAMVMDLRFENGKRLGNYEWEVQK